MQTTSSTQSFSSQFSASFSKNHRPLLRHPPACKQRRDSEREGQASR
uniref:Uncharacterized protein n=1 Tax=Rhizophora mucronata TaxID=61149 RepID=A0A2P2Q064_RHIMU